MHVHVCIPPDTVQYILYIKFPHTASAYVPSAPPHPLLYPCPITSGGQRYAKVKRRYVEV
jgi:hypothetical protein